MKKLITIILILALALPALAMADESDVIGCWTHYTELTTGGVGVEFLYLAEDHKCYYLIQNFNTEKASLGRTYVGTWEMQEDGTVVAKTGNTAKTKLKFSEGYSLAMSDLLSVFVNITPFTLGGL